VSDERKEDRARTGAGLRDGDEPLKIIADMRQDGELLRRYADRFEAAWGRQRAEWEAKTLRELAIARDEMKEEYRKIYGGNVTKLREALLYVRNVLELNGFYEPAKRCDDALSAPQRNCDVGSAEEQAQRFHAFCHDHRAFDTHCSNDCPFKDTPDINHCQSGWGQLPYDAAPKGGAK